MNKFIISPYAISWDSIKNNLQQYVANKNNQGWKDFYASSAGETLIELMAALGTFYAYQFIAGRRESFLSFAQNYSSVLGLAQNLGYSASRGNNLKLELNITPNTDPSHTFKKWDVIGKYSIYDVVVLEDTDVKTDDSGKVIQTTIPVVIGNLLSETKQIDDNLLQQFTFANSNSTNDCTITLNDVEVPTSTNIADALNDKYIMITNSLGAVDVFYLNNSENAKYTYKAQDKLSFVFVERNDLTWSAFSNSNLDITVAERVDATTNYIDRTDKETIENIKVKAPIYHETACAIRSRRDYSKFLLTKGVDLLNYNKIEDKDNIYRDIIDANDRDIYPGLIEITYLKDNGSLMTNEEKEYWLNEIEEARPSGVARAIITDPSYIYKKLNIKIWRSANETLSGDTKKTIQETILNPYNNKLGKEVDLDQIEHDIEDLSGVKIARVNAYSKERTENTYYDLFDIIETPNKQQYYFGNFIYTSGKNEPEWTTNLDDLIIDNGLIWKKVNKFEATVINEWKPNTKFEKYDYIKVTKDDKTHIFVCDSYVNATSDIEPTWGEDTVFDNTIIWKKEIRNEKEEQIIYDSWQPNIITNINDKITVGEDNYVCYGFRGLTSNTEINWNDTLTDTVVDGNIEWVKISENNRKINLGWNQYIKLDMDYIVVG